MASPSHCAIVSALIIFVSCGTCPPLPFIASISPSTVMAGGNQFILTVNGNDFRRDSTVSWNTASLVTGFVSSQQLTAVVPVAEIAHPGAALVSVFNPPEGRTTFVSGGIGVASITSCSGRTSNALSITVDP